MKCALRSTFLCCGLFITRTPQSISILNEFIGQMHTRAYTIDNEGKWLTTSWLYERTNMLMYANALSYIVFLIRNQAKKKNTHSTINRKKRWTIKSCVQNCCFAHTRNNNVDIKKNLPPWPIYIVFTSARLNALLIEAQPKMKLPKLLSFAVMSTEPSADTYLFLHWHISPRIPSNKWRLHRKSVIWSRVLVIIHMCMTRYTSTCPNDEIERSRSAHHNQRTNDAEEEKKRNCALQQQMIFVISAQCLSKWFSYLSLPMSRFPKLKLRQLKMQTSAENSRNEMGTSARAKKENKPKIVYTIYGFTRTAASVWIDRLYSKFECCNCVWSYQCDTNSKQIFLKSVSKWLLASYLFGMVSDRDYR